MVLQVAGAADDGASGGITAALMECTVDEESSSKWYHSLPASQIPFLAIMPNAEVRSCHSVVNLISLCCSCRLLCYVLNLPLNFILKAVPVDLGRVWSCNC